MNKKLLVALVLVMSVFSIFSRGQTTKEATFWNWFFRNEARIYDLEKDQNRIFTELSSELKKIDANLTFEFGPIQQGIRDFVISADGIKKSFPIVVDLADKAPKLLRFKIIKFRPRRPPFAEIKYEGLTIRLEQIKFSIERDGDKAGITIFIDGFNDAKRNAYVGVAFLYLDNCLGEYDVETKVGAIEVKALTEPSKTEKVPLAQIASTFDSFFAKNPNED
ncbi:MAG: hypothetical protein ABL952_16285 [Pyrinomonadaceae bacterium]